MGKHFNLQLPLNQNLWFSITMSDNQENKADTEDRSTKPTSSQNFILKRLSNTNITLQSELKIPNVKYQQLSRRWHNMHLLIMWLSWAVGHCNTCIPISMIKFWTGWCKHLWQYSSSLTIANGKLQRSGPSSHPFSH
jgi:hypothetical protein